ncbi:hypothetical protein M378DRAFT_658431 [Amanita muscaria Koide BX008]|uniref:protein-serine/threonine phosphatase n=1 Tax=Amanita muscaria (strain Koide BX008) TaxID=946122 RepID=A0A0C2WER4_AMAMK|nr:hypothetical protein M378DRAFT_658431 [Amanita muscaria Koide BX008]
MVVVIDDRADVWEWSPNLIKVIPYDFFIGIGDINSSFLPKIEPLTAGSPAQTTPSNPSSAPTTPEPNATQTPEGAEEAEAATNAMLRENTMVLELQLEQRPLAKKQTELEQITSTDQSQQQDQSEQRDVKAVHEGVPDQEHGHERKALLKNDDRELDCV